jgi:hypothetical protein
VGDTRNAHKNLVIKDEWKRLPGRPRNRWEDNVEINHTEIGGNVWTESDWGYGPLVGSCVIMIL